MKLGSPGLWLGATSMGLVLLLVYKDLENTAPGPLSATHAQEAKLAGAEGCVLCHGSERHALALACIECHAAVGSQVEDGQGFHGGLEDVSDCGRCHLEHEGTDFRLVNEHAFALAGVADRDAYDHAGLDFALVGVHASLDCASCHASADKDVVAPGEARFLGLTGACADCHTDPHGGEMSQDCESCHGQERPFAEVAEFEHVARFPLADAHADIACVACHAEGSEHSIAAVLDPGAARAGRNLAERACEDCHASPHAPSFLTQLEPDAQACSTCHATVHGGFTANASMDPALHAAAGFALEEPHANLDCAACHGSLGGQTKVLGPDFAQRHPGRRADDCAACHADPHGDQFADRTCVSCHTKSFEPNDFDVARHALTTFPLTGKHATTDCHACHVVDSGPADIRSFEGTQDACDACHADAHEGAFDQLGPPSNPTASGCARCHTTTEFEAGARERFDHDAWTPFPLAGAHAAADCEVCHAPAAERDALGRIFGRVHDTFPGPVGRCDTCHADAHAGAFGHAGELEGDASCARCHDQSSFADVDPARFDHGEWTPFPLAGAHAAADCEVCHAPEAERDAFGRIFGRVHDTFPGPVGRCDTCHADAHAGAFEWAFERAGGPSAEASCAQCHDQASFADVEPERFDHGEWTGFVLDGGHARAECSSCHPAAETADALGRRFGRALEVELAECSACHADPHGGVFAGDARTTDCAACHVTSTFGAVAHDAFDHAAHTGFPLVGSHANASCTSCHAQTAPDEQGRTFGRAAGTSCSDCHADPHVGQFARARGSATDCARCHSNVSDFHALTFDHGLDARFALDKVHRKLDCAACHKPWKLAGGRTTVRYRPLGTACADCHKTGGGR